MKLSLPTIDALRTILESSRSDLESGWSTHDGMEAIDAARVAVVPDMIRAATPESVAASADIVSELWHFVDLQAAAHDESDTDARDARAMIRDLRRIVAAMEPAARASVRVPFLARTFNI